MLNQQALAVEVLPEITVDVTSLSKEEKLRQELAKVSGATNLITAEETKRVAKINNADLFRNQPGIYAASSGNEGIKLSIRGSGINRAPRAHGSGLYVTLDDLPFTGPGGTPYELLEPLWVDTVEVLRGANGLQRGALNLGGNINYSTPTGKDAAKLKLHHELGSRGYQKSEISSGQPRRVIRMGFKIIHPVIAKGLLQILAIKSIQRPIHGFIYVIVKRIIKHRDV